MFVCEVMMLKRFFKHEKVVSMIEMMKTKMKDEELVNTLKQYGPGLDYIYLEGMEKGESNGIAKGEAKGEAKIVKNLLIKGLDEEFILQVTDLSLSEIKKIKRNL